LRSPLCFLDRRLYPTSIDILGFFVIFSIVFFFVHIIIIIIIIINNTTAADKTTKIRGQMSETNSIEAQLLLQV
jgi:hypothetical protein